MKTRLLTLPETKRKKREYKKINIITRISGGVNPPLPSSRYHQSNAATISTISRHGNPVIDAVFSAEPWTAKTIWQAMLLWLSAFLLLGSWVTPIIAHSIRLRKSP